MKKNFLLFAFLLLLCGCASRSRKADPPLVVSMQIVDRNGFSETISTKERLAAFQKVDFLTPQPYQKILRVFKRGGEGKSSSKITSYHPNGQIYQYLEVIDGRAHGNYREWHENGKLKLEATVIEGIADISDIAQASWLFDGASFVRDEAGNLLAEIFYDKGRLHAPSLYYHPNGKIWKKIPYDSHEIDGDLFIWDDKENLREKISYQKGVKQGISEGFWEGGKQWYQEVYDRGLLQKAFYFDFSGKLSSEIHSGNGFQALFKEGVLYSLQEYQGGIPQGKVETFDNKGSLSSSYFIKEGKKHGEEILYYQINASSLQPKLSLFWHEGSLQGTVKTWYENGQMESQKEMSGNKRQGLSFAWFKNGDLMLIEEYENDLLEKGTYFKKGEKTPVSKIEGGSGVATLYDHNGRFVKKISYDKRKPLLDSNS